MAAVTVAAAAVLAVLLRQPACWADRHAPPGAKATQLGYVARAIAEASPDLPTAAYLLDVGWHESKWCLDVHSGERRGGRGEGLWQLEGSHHAAGARSGLSLDETRSAAALAAFAIGHSFQCGHSPAAVLTGYAGRPCYQAREEGWPTLDSRVRGYWWALGALRKAGAT